MSKEQINMDDFVGTKEAHHKVRWYLPTIHRLTKVNVDRETLITHISGLGQIGPPLRLDKGTYTFPVSSTLSDTAAWEKAFHEANPKPWHQPIKRWRQKRRIKELQATLEANNE